MSRLWNYATTYGQRYIHTILGTIGGGSAILTFLPNTVYVDRYKEFFQLYRKSFPLKVNEEINDILAEVSEDLNLAIRNPEVLLFHTIGQSPNRFGSAWSNCQCYIGLPVHFSYRTVKDIDETIMVGEKKVNWESKEGDTLKESLLLSKKAVKYAIAHELKLAHGPILFLNASYPMFVIVSLMSLNNLVIDKIIHSRNPTVYMKLFYASLAVLGLGFYFMLKDCTYKFLELKADEELAKLSDDYLLGGIEFLEKQLLMNIAFRSLLPDGSSEYTAEGEEIHLFRRKKSPILERLRIFKNELNAQRSKNTQTSESYDLNDADANPSSSLNA